MSERKNNSQGNDHRSENSRGENPRSDRPQKVFNNHEQDPNRGQMNQNGWLSRLQKSARPMAHRLQRWQTKLDEGAILRKRIIVLSLLGLIVISLAAGKLMSPPASIVETSPGTQKEFVSGETIAMQKSAYDKNTHTVRLDLQTSSPTGVLSPQDLSVDFTSLKKPSNKLPAPQLYLIPTINNHYIVVIRNVYSGFQAMEMVFHNKTDSPIAQYRDALNDGSNGASDSELNGASSELGSNQHVGAPHLTDHNKDLLTSQSSDPDVQSQQRTLLQKLSQNNNQLIVLRESTMFAKSGSIPSTLDPKDISINDINGQIDRLHSKVNNTDNGIQQNNALLKKMDKQSSTLSKDAGIDKNYKNEIDSLNQNINNTKKSISDSHKQITQYNKQIGSYNDELNQLKNDRIQFNSPVQQSGNSFNSK